MSDSELLRKRSNEHDSVVSILRDTASSAMRRHIMTVGREYEAYIEPL